MSCAVDDVLATRVWTMEDQRRFASATGDVNPIHMDPVAARRTAAGSPAVHGVHVALWALETAAGPRFQDLSAIQLRFERFVTVGDRTELVVLDEPGRLSLAVCLGDARAVSVRGTFGSRGSRSEAPSAPRCREIPQNPDVWAMTAGHPPAESFRISDPSELVAMAPRLAGFIGASRVTALGALSTLVGMFVPGLHSILSKMDVDLVEPSYPEALTFAVTRTQPLLNSVSLSARGAGLAAKVDAFVRPTPVEQPRTSELRMLVPSNEFSGRSALIIGGSRGLGEATAKLLAAGGASVCITYVSGEADAQAVAADIAAAGGRCQVLRYDARMPASPQLADLPFAPTNLFYFATPRVFRQKRALLEIDSLDEMTRIYNVGFYNACLACVGMGALVSAFYPSTVALDQAPRNLTEYLMAKAAGEVLAREIARSVPGLRVLVERLPRIDTDQTATVLPVPAMRATDVMLPIIRRDGVPD